MKHLKLLGVATVYVDCDLPVKLQEARLASITLCSSEYLAKHSLDDVRIREI
jgi:hypothetical protein